MKNLLPFLILGVALVIVSCKEETSITKLDSFEDSLSYSFGVQVAEMIKQQGEVLDPEVVAQAVREALEEKARMTIDQCQEVMQSNAIRKSEAALGEGKAYLVENAAKEGVKVTESGLQYRTITEGTGKSPAATSSVTVHYKLKLTDGTEIESSFDSGQPVSFPLDRVIRGWTEGLQLMKEGGKMELVVPSDLGYGPQPSGPIPGGSVLVFEIELISVDN